MSGRCRSCVRKERLNWRELPEERASTFLRPHAHSLGPDSLLEVVLARATRCAQATHFRGSVGSEVVMT